MNSTSRVKRICIQTVGQTMMVLVVSITGLQDAEALL
jgi:hypothetical protein